MLGLVEDRFLHTRIGAQSCAQVATRGMIAAAFDHWDTRTGDPNLHTHVVIANKVQGPDGKWRSVGRPAPYHAAVACSEVYDDLFADALAARLPVTWGWRRPRASGARPRSRSTASTTTCSRCSPPRSAQIDAAPARTARRVHAPSTAASRTGGRCCGCASRRPWPPARTSRSAAGRAARPLAGRPRPRSPATTREQILRRALASRALRQRPWRPAEVPDACVEHAGRRRPVAGGAANAARPGPGRTCSPRPPAPPGSCALRDPPERIALLDRVVDAALTRASPWTRRSCSRPRPVPPRRRHQRLHPARRARLHHHRRPGRRGPPARRQPPTTGAPRV